MPTKTTDVNITLPKQVSIDVFPFHDVGKVGVHLTFFEVFPVHKDTNFRIADFTPVEARQLARALYHAAREIERYDREVEAHFKAQEAKNASKA